MALQSIHAHYDGKQILLDEAVELPVGRRLLVTVLEDTNEAADFRALASSSLNKAYGDDEPEYTEADVRP